MRTRWTRGSLGARCSSRPSYTGNSVLAVETSRAGGACRPQASGSGVTPWSLETVEPLNSGSTCVAAAGARESLCSGRTRSTEPGRARRALRPLETVKTLRPGRSRGTDTCRPGGALLSGWTSRTLDARCTRSPDASRAGCTCPGRSGSSRPCSARCAYTRSAGRPGRSCGSRRPTCSRSARLTSTGRTRGSRYAIDADRARGARCTSGAGRSTRRSGSACGTCLPSATPAGGGIDVLVDPAAGKPRLA